MVEVDKKTFYEAVGPLDVHPRIVSSWPFTSIWEMRRQTGNPVVGRTVGHKDGSTTCFLTRE